jgi:hypothetical protein
MPDDHYVEPSRAKGEMLCHVAESLMSEPDRAIAVSQPVDYLRDRRPYGSQ